MNGTNCVPDYSKEYWNKNTSICPINVIKDSLKSLNFKQEIQNVIKNNIQDLLGNIIETDFYIISISEPTSESNKDYVIIVLGECEEKIKKYYNVDKIYIEIIEKKYDNWICIYIEFEIYLTNETKVSKSICNGDDIYIFTLIRNYDQIDLNSVSNFNDQRINIFNNKDDSFFNEICYTYTTNTSTDTTLNNRQETYYQNISFC